MSDDPPDLHLKLRNRNSPLNPYKWEIYRGNDPICIKRAMHAYPTQQAAANAGEKALLRFLESEALKQERPTSISSRQSPRMTTPNPLIDGMMKVARLAAAAQCANAPEGPAPSAQVHAEGFEQALRALRAACPLPFEKRAGRGRPRDARSCCGRSPRYGRWRSGAPPSSARASGTDEVGLTPDDFNAFEKILAEVQSAYSAEDLARLRTIPRASVSRKKAFSPAVCVRRIDRQRQAN